MQTRREAIESWDRSLETLSTSYALYQGETSQLFRYFNREDADSSNEGNAQGDLTEEDALRHIDDRLRHLQNLEDELHKTRIALQGLRNTSTTLSPINRLPPEIISYIIELGVIEDQIAKIEKELRIEVGDGPVDDVGEAIIEPDPPHFPTLVSHICKRWRRIALSNSSFWTKLDFHDGPPFHKAIEWITRSKQSELEVILDSQDDKAGLNVGDALEEALAVVDPHAARINSLFVRMSSVTDLAHVLRHLTSGDKGMPLKTLALIAEEYGGNLPQAELQQSRQRLLRDMLENLQELELEKVHIPWGHARLRGLKRLRLSALTEEGEIPTAAQLHALLSESPQLELVEFDAIDLSDVDTVELSAFPPIRLPKLTDLALSQLEPFMQRFLFSIIDPPHLARLSLADIDPTSGMINFTKIITQFFGRIWKDTLRFLRIEECTFRDRELIPMLSNSRALEEIHFCDCEGFRDTILRTLIDDGGSPACPNLDSIRLENVTLAESVLKELVEARQASEHPLKSVTIKYCGVEQDLEAWLQLKVPQVVFDMDSDDEMGTDDDADMTTDGSDIDMWMDPLG